MLQGVEDLLFPALLPSPTYSSAAHPWPTPVGKACALHPATPAVKSRRQQVQLLPEVPVSVVSAGLRRGAEGQPQLHAAEIIDYLAKLKLPKVRALGRVCGVCALHASHQ